MTVCVSGFLLHSHTRMWLRPEAFSTSAKKTTFSACLVPPYPPARYTFIHALLFLHSGHLCIRDAHASQHTRWPHSL